MNSLRVGGGYLVSVLIITILDQEMLALLKSKVASPELSAPGFSYLINVLMSVLFEKFANVQQKSKEELLK